MTTTCQHPSYPAGGATHAIRAMAFHTWGMDILGPFHKATGQLKHLLVVVDYFTKWIETEPLATITSARVESFTFKTIICRFGIPAVIVIDNGTQFTGSPFKDLLQGLQIRHHFSSVEHPKTNGQAEVANKVILNGLRKRLEKRQRSVGG